jgi:lysophospholipid acyltransferase (LPLAT)-like uncharacterized protein
VENLSKSSATPTGASGETQPTIPAPPLSLWRRLEIPVIAWAVSAVIRLIGPTLRTEVIGVHNAIQIPRGGEPAIGAFWHRCIFSAAWIFRRRGIVVLNTVNFDGQWTRRVIERLGFGTAQGSSTRGALEGLTAMAAHLQAGRHVGFTIDGPRGPRYVAKPGPVILARRTGRPISVFHIAVERGHTFENAWDLFCLPYPFSRTVMFVAPPIRVPTDAGSDTMKEKQAEMQTALESVRNLAESWFQLTDEKRDQIRDEWREPGLARNRSTNTRLSDERRQDP